jgi:hypothetical protein
VFKVPRVRVKTLAKFINEINLICNAMFFRVINARQNVNSKAVFSSSFPGA